MPCPATARSAVSSHSTWASNTTLGLDTTNAPTAGFSYAGVIAGAMGLNKLGPGTLVLTASNIYSGGTTISAGTLQLGDGAANNGYVSGNIATAAGTGLTFANPSAQTYSGAISGSGSLTMNGPGLLSLGANVNSPVNTYTGGTTVSGGTLVLNCNPGDSGTGTIRGALTINPGAVVQLNVKDAVGYGTTSVTTVNIVGGDINNNINNWQAFTTNFNLTGGTISAINGNSSSNNNNPAFNFNTGYGITTYGSTSTSLISAGILIRAGTLAFDVGSGTTSSGIDLKDTGVIAQVSNGLGITKSGPGLMQLTAANTYTGLTTVSAGTLELGDGATINGSVAGNIADNATLIFANPSAQTYSGLISGGGSLTKIGAGTLTLSGTETYSGTTTVNAGNLAYSSSSAVSSNSITINPGGAVNVSGAYPTVTAWLGSNLINPASTGAVALAGTSNETISMGGYSTLSLGAVAGGATYSGG